MFRSPVDLLGKVLLVPFLLWHMFAVAIYSIPRDAKDVFSQWSRIDLLPAVTPYMYATSQWQLWNIFSPDPLRRVTAYRIEIQKDGLWQHLLIVDPSAFSLFRHATQMKLMGNILDEFRDNRAPLAGRYLSLLCAEYQIASDTPIHLIYDVYVLPLLDTPHTVTWWRQWEPEPFSTLGFTTTCP